MYFCCFSAFIAVRRCQPETQPAFFDFKEETAILIVIGLLVQLGVLNGMHNENSLSNPYHC